MSSYRELAMLALLAAAFGGAPQLAAAQNSDPTAAAAAASDSTEAPPSTAVRRQITVALPIPRKATSGELIVRPNVNVNTISEGSLPTDTNGAPLTNPAPPVTVQPYRMRSVSTVITQPSDSLAQAAAPPGPAPEVLPAPMPGNAATTDIQGDWTQPFGPGMEPAIPTGPCDPCPPKHRYGRRDPVSGVLDYGIGHERVQVAPFGLDVSQPFTNIKLRTDFGYGEQNPDRDEFFWAAPITAGGKGPALPEQKVNYQDVNLYMEQALNPSFSVATNIPLRYIDPVNNGNTAGLGDMNVATKLVLLNGRKWQLTQLFRTYIPTGAFDRGLGTGHVSLQPGILGRYQWTPETYFHANLEFWVPIGGDMPYDGTIVSYAFGISHVWYDSDSFAVLPTFELLGSSAMSGSQTSPLGLTQSVDTLTVLNLMPGIRFVRDTCSDCGLFEAGIAFGYAVTNNCWYRSLLRLEM
ncbi:MAG TPA: transporter, partial [Pirellulales bacterium]|nr:transporter [Pirellulales bacterium]